VPIGEKHPEYLTGQGRPVDDFVKRRQGGPAMKIADSAIQLSSQHTSLERNEQRESLTVWKSGQDRRTLTDAGVNGRNLTSLKKMAMDLSVKVSLSAEVKQMRSVQQKTERNIGQDEAMVDLKLLILQEMIERLTGRKIQTTHVDEVVQAESAPVVQTPVANGQTAPAQQGNVQGQNAGFGAVYEYHASHYESESTSFAAQGKILTTDGKEIEFSTQLNMSRENYSEQNITIKAGEALKDPLVINFDGTAAQLTQTEFQFDLNIDGAKEQIAFVAPGSGFLALDKNGDNSINNGSELFGPGTGNGFNELAAYDSDGNNWIDENDAVFALLRIWTKDNAGNDQLFTLSQKGVGALFLGNVATPFSIKDGDDALVGQVRSTGVFLQENGSVGTLQQIDLVA
jgi:hypothetical protein